MYVFFCVCVCMCVVRTSLPHTRARVCVCSGLNISASLLLCNWTDIWEQEMRNTRLIAFSIPPSRLIWLFRHQSCNKEKTEHTICQKRKIKEAEMETATEKKIRSWWSVIKKAAETTTGCTVDQIFWLLISDEFTGTPDLIVLHAALKK